MLRSEYKSVAKYNVVTGSEIVKFYGNNKKISRNAYLKKCDRLLKWKRIMVDRSL